MKKIVIIGFIIVIPIMFVVLTSLDLFSYTAKPTPSPPSFSLPPTTIEKNRTVVNVVMNQTDNGNFILYMSNQSPKISLVDATIRVDNKLVLEGKFDFFGIGVAQNWREFHFFLPIGPHRINVESTDGNATLEQEFKINGTEYAIVDYWYDPEHSITQKHFNFDIGSKQPNFE